MDRPFKDKQLIITKTSSDGRLGGDFFGLLLLVLLLTVFGLSGCKDSFLKQTTADKTSAVTTLVSEVDAAGNVTAAFDPSSSQTQLLELNSGSLAGAAVAIPPGSLAIPLSVVIGEGESLGTSSFSQQIGLTDNTLTASGPSVSFIPSENVEASNPFTLAIPFSAVTGLHLTNDTADFQNLVVMFRSIKVENGVTSYQEGVIPRRLVTVARDKVTFQTRNFGVFQVGVAQKKIEEKITRPAVRAPVLVAEVGNPLVGVWRGTCEVAEVLPDRDSVQVPDGFFNNETRTGLALTDLGFGGGGTEGSNTGGGAEGSPSEGTGEGGECQSIEVLISSRQIVAGPNFYGGRTFLRFSDELTDLPFGYLPAESQLGSRDGTLTLGSASNEDFPSGQASADLILPSECQFVNGTIFSPAMTIQKNYFSRPDGGGVCRFDLSTSIETILCATTSSSDSQDGAASGSATSGSTPSSRSIDMGRDGDQWFGRVYGMRYWKRGTLGINRGEIFWTSEYFKDQSCSAMVSSKTEVLAYEMSKVDMPETIPVDIKSLKASGRIVSKDWFSSTDRRERYIGSCGISDWRFGEERDLPSGKSCFVSKKMSSLLQIREDILYLCGESKNALEERPKDCSSAFLKFKRSKGESR